MTLGHRVRERRKTLSLTQSELASRVGVSQSTIVRTEKNETIPDGATLLAMARELGVSVHWLINGREGDPPHIDEGDEPGVDGHTPDEMPETLGQRRDYARQEAAARKELARRDESVEEWVWPHVRAANNFTLADTPPSVAMLVELARFIAAHGDPSVQPKDEKKKKKSS
ncbi:MAG: helix-turn-helix transcriptional regulator [Polyangiales bacterium]